MSINVDILVAGKSVRKFTQPNTLNTFIEGRKGSEYTIRIRNNKWNRIKVIVSVDGLNVLTGDNVWERGYVIEPNQTIDIPGWRIDQTKVSAFEFSSVGGAYQGDKGNVGVIGVMAYEEEVAVWTDLQIKPDSWTRPRYTFGTGGGGGGGAGWGGFYGNSIRCSSSLSGAQGSLGLAGTPTASASVNNLGTGWGDEKSFQTREVNYTFKNYTSDIVTLYYDNAKGLKARGIVLQEHVVQPVAFPGYQDFGCKPPAKVRKRRTVA